MKTRFAAMALAGLLAGTMAAQAKELAGVKVPDTLIAGGTTLKLNGLGLRKKAIFSVYVGGLYLVAPSKDAAAVLAADAPKAVSMHFLRGVTKAQLIDAFREGFEGKEFSDVIFALWLGPKPPTEGLRKGMLGT